MKNPKDIFGCLCLVLLVALSLLLCGCKTNSSGWPIIWPFNNGVPVEKSKPLTLRTNAAVEMPPEPPSIVVTRAAVIQTNKTPPRTVTLIVGTPPSVPWMLQSKSGVNGQWHDDLHFSISNGVAIVTNKGASRFYKIRLVR